MGEPSLFFVPKDILAKALFEVILYITNREARQEDEWIGLSRNFDLNIFEQGLNVYANIHPVKDKRTIGDVWATILKTDDFILGWK